MNKKGQLSVGAIVIIAIAIILGAVFMGVIADEQSDLTNKRSVTNETVTFPANGSTLTLNGQAIDGSVTAINNSDNESFQVTISSGNFTVDDFVLTGGEYRAILTVVDPEFASESVNLTYDYEPVGYNSDSGSRGILTIVLIFFALAVFTLALPGVREWLDMK